MRRAALFIALLAASAAAAQPADCALTETDKRANAALGFEDFDQKGSLPSSSRALSQRGCGKKAIEAAEDYLINGPLRTEWQQRMIVWHMAQDLAIQGQEREAARLMAAARDAEGSGERIDWNSYVAASWAFLVKDRPLFDAAAARLAASSRTPDRVNSAIVAAMGRCWGKPYRVAYNPECGMQEPAN